MLLIPRLFWVVDLPKEIKTKKQSPYDINPELFAPDTILLTVTLIIDGQTTSISQLFQLIGKNNGTMDNNF